MTLYTLFAGSDSKNSYSLRTSACLTAIFSSSNSARGLPPEICGRDRVSLNGSPDIATSLPKADRPAAT